MEIAEKTLQGMLDNLDTIHSISRARMDLKTMHILQYLAEFRICKASIPRQTSKTTTLCKFAEANWADTVLLLSDGSGVAQYAKIYPKANIINGNHSLKRNVYPGTRGLPRGEPFRGVTRINHILVDEPERMLSDFNKLFLEWVGRLVSSGVVDPMTVKIVMLETARMH
jgi:hypothetical protein